MQANAVLINASRGNVVDIDALAAALRERRILGAAIDVFPEEPQSNDEPFASPLLDCDNVIVTPHAAWYSEKAMVGLQEGAPNEVRRVLTGEWPVNVVNPAVRGKTRAKIAAPKAKTVRAKSPAKHVAKKKSSSRR